MGASEAAGAGSAATEDASSGWWGEGSLVRSISGKVGGWFATPAMDLETRARHLATLRERFPDFPPEDAARFLSARGDALDSAAEMIDKHLVWRAETLPVDPDHPGVRAELDKGVFRRVGRDVKEDPSPCSPRIATAKRPHRRTRHTNDGPRHRRAIAAIPKAKESDTHEEKDDPPTERRRGRDAGGDGLDTFSLILYAPAGTELDVALVSALASTFQENYPERLHKLYALPTGVLTRVMWEGVRPFLSAATSTKVVLTSGGQRPRELERAISVETLREAIVAMDPMAEGEDPWAEGTSVRRAEEESEEESEEDSESGELVGSQPTQLNDTLRPTR